MSGPAYDLGRKHGTKRGLITGIVLGIVGTVLLYWTWFGYLPVF